MTQDLTNTAPVPDPSGRARRSLLLRRIGLSVLCGPDTGVSAVYEDDVVRIGTSPGNHLALTDPSISRRHAEITRTPQGFVLRDLGSSNGTFVQARERPMRVKEVFLDGVHTFQVGETELAFEILDERIEVVPSEQSSFEGLVGRSLAMRELYTIVEQVARTELTVLVLGETGTGKELVSRAIHRRSRRSEGPFVVFDGSSASASLAEDELFGHVRGAFTSAVSDRAGAFELAHGGTLFIDELGELPLPLQALLLRALEQREVRRLGAQKTQRVDVRVVAATHRDLQAMVRQGTFREDLYYRLAVVELALPPLRERLDDLPALVSHLLQSASFEHGIRGVTPEVLAQLQARAWPGNVRELRNTLLRAIPFCQGALIDVQALSALGPAQNKPRSEPCSEAPAAPLVDVALPMKEAREQWNEHFERAYLEALLARAGGNLSEAARVSRVDRKTIARLLKKRGMS